MSRQNKAKFINKNDVSNGNTGNYLLELFLAVSVAIAISLVSRHHMNEKFIDLISNTEKINIIAKNFYNNDKDMNTTIIQKLANAELVYNEKINIIDNGISFNINEKLCNTLKNEVLSIKGNVYINNKEVSENTECSVYNEGAGKIIFKK